MLGESADDSDCDSCVPPYVRNGIDDGERIGGVLSLLGAALFFLFFLLAILAAIAFLVSRIFPEVAGSGRVHGLKFLGPSGSRKRFVALTLCATVILTAILTELILCEIAKCLPAHVRSVAMRATMLMLLVILVLLTPALEIHTIVSSKLMKHETEWSMVRSSKKKVMTFLEGFMMLGWLVGYWSIGNILSTDRQGSDGMEHRQSLVEEYLKCTGVIGICLMASLAGFAAVSSVWQTFGHKERPITESDISRKQYGLEATTEMLTTKEHRLRALDRRMAESTSMKEKNNRNNNSIMTRAISSISSSISAVTTTATSDSVERRSLEVEINGLQCMRDKLSPELYALRNRREAQLHAATPAGRRLALLKRLFALYCLYRLGTVALAVLARTLHFLFQTSHARSLNNSYSQSSSPPPPPPAPPSLPLSSSNTDTDTAMNTFTHNPDSNTSLFSASSTDPITNILALLARHVDPALDRDAWSRQISFALSGAMLLASVSSAMQTFLLLSRLAPAGLLIRAAAQANLALLVSQVAATYVMASALLLRSNLPKEVGTDISDALGIGLEPRFVEWWFESCFLAVAVLTAFGIWLGRKVKGSGLGFGDDFDDEDGYNGFDNVDLELCKKS